MICKGCGLLLSSEEMGLNTAGERVEYHGYQAKCVELLRVERERLLLQNSELQKQLADPTRKVPESWPYGGLSWEKLAKHAEEGWRHSADNIAKWKDMERLNGELQKQLADEEASHAETMAERDRWEEALGELASDAGCAEEWGNLHSHGDCITNLWDAKVTEVLRWAHGMLCPQSSEFRDADCICDETFKKSKTERPIHEIPGDQLLKAMAKLETLPDKRKCAVCGGDLPDSCYAKEVNDEPIR